MFLSIADLWLVRTRSIAIVCWVVAVAPVGVTRAGAVTTILTSAPAGPGVVVEDFDAYAFTPGDLSVNLFVSSLDHQTIELATGQGGGLVHSGLKIDVDGFSTITWVDAGFNGITNKSIYNANSAQIDIDVASLSASQLGVDLTTFANVSDTATVSVYDPQGGLMATVNNVGLTGGQTQFVGFENSMGFGRIEVRGSSGTTSPVLERVVFRSGAIAIAEPSSIVAVGMLATGAGWRRWRRRCG